jgi:hypothetical protein
MSARFDSAFGATAGFAKAVLGRAKMHISGAFTWVLCVALVV